MIDIKELRIGNLVEVGRFEAFEGEPKSVNIPISIELLVEMSNNDGVARAIKPIPITPEWLERFGFEHKFKDERNLYYIDLLSVAAEDDNWDELWLDTFYKGLYIGVNPCNVHQLQNVYYALTGEELTLKNEPTTVEA